MSLSKTLGGAVTKSSTEQYQTGQLLTLRTFDNVQNIELKFVLVDQISFSNKTNKNQVRFCHRRVISYSYQKTSVGSWILIRVINYQNWKQLYQILNVWNILKRSHDHFKTFNKDLLRSEHFAIKLKFLAVNRTSLCNYFKDLVRSSSLSTNAIFCRHKTSLSHKSCSSSSMLIQVLHRQD